MERNWFEKLTSNSIGPLFVMTLVLQRGSIADYCASFFISNKNWGDPPIYIYFQVILPKKPTSIENGSHVNTKIYQKALHS